MRRVSRGDESEEASVSGQVNLVPCTEAMTTTLINVTDISRSLSDSFIVQKSAHRSTASMLHQREPNSWDMCMVLDSGHDFRFPLGVTMSPFKAQKTFPGTRYSYIHHIVRHRSEFRLMSLVGTRTLRIESWQGTSHDQETSRKDIIHVLTHILSVTT